MRTHGRRAPIYIGLLIAENPRKTVGRLAGLKFKILAI